MKLKTLIEIANKAYPDGMVGLYFDEPDGHHGDTLAKFISRELTETFDETASDEVQLETARRVMLTAANEISSVKTGFDDALYDLPGSSTV